MLQEEASAVNNCMAVIEHMAEVRPPASHCARLPPRQCCMMPA